MGTTYSFTKIPKADFSSGKLLALRGKPLCIDGVDFFSEDDPVLQMLDENSIAELDRDYFIWNLLGLSRDMPDKYGEFTGRKEYEDWFHYYQCIPITEEMVKRGIKTLEALDAKVFSMPHRPWPGKSPNRFAGVCVKEFAKEFPCTEPVQEDGRGSGTHFFFGRDEQDIAIVKEVFKVYGHREFHYGYPWDDSPWGVGSRGVQGALKEVLKEMAADTDGRFEFLLQWY